jgi:hypothetical protein
MAVDFYFYLGWIDSPWAWLSFILPIIAYAFLIVGAFDLKKDERQFGSVQFLSTMGIILLTWTIVSRFLPSIMFSSSYPDVLVGFSYIMTLWLLNDTFFIMLGIAFLMFGSKNREHNGALMTAAGILFMVGWIFNMAFSDIIYLIDVLLDPPLFDIPSMLYTSSAYLTIILGLVAAILFLVYTIIIKKVFLIISSAFFVTIYTFGLLGLVGAIGYFSI